MNTFAKNFKPMTGEIVKHIEQGMLAWIKRQKVTSAEKGNYDCNYIKIKI